MRIYVHPMLSNTRNLAGDSGFTIPVSLMRAFPDWRFYFGMPIEWPRLERALKVLQEMPNVTVVPQRYYGTNRNLNNWQLDFEGLDRFRPCLRSVDVDCAWFFVPELVPAWKALLRHGYPDVSGGQGLAPVVTTCFNGLREERHKNDFIPTTVLGQAIGFFASDEILWECPWIMEHSLAIFSTILNQKALGEIQRKSMPTGQPIMVEEYAFPIEKNEKFTIALNHKLIEQKGVRETFEVYDRLWMLGYEFEVWIWDTSGRGYRVGGRPYAVNKGGVSREQYLRDLSRCHVLVSHSRWDAFGRSYLDCMMLEMPFLCRKELVFPFMVGPDYEWHFEDNDQCLAYLKHFMEHRDEARVVGRRLRQYVSERFDLPVIAGIWRAKTEGLVQRNWLRCRPSPDREHKILEVAKYLYEKIGPFTKVDLEREVKRLYGHGLSDPPQGHPVKTRQALLKGGWKDDYTRDEATYSPGGYDGQAGASSGLVAGTGEDPDGAGGLDRLQSVEC